MLKLKSNAVKVDELHPAMWFALGVATLVFQQVTNLDCIVTSAKDGSHNPNSLHPKGRAVDLRTWHVGSMVSRVMAELQKRLEPAGFDVIYEGKNATAATTDVHIHIEFDPKNGEELWKYL